MLPVRLQPSGPGPDQVGVGQSYMILREVWGGDKYVKDACIRPRFVIVYASPVGCHLCTLQSGDSRYEGMRKSLTLD